MPMVKSCGQMAPNCKCNARDGSSVFFSSRERKERKKKGKEKKRREEEERKKENSFEKETVTDADG